MPDPIQTGMLAYGIHRVHNMRTTAPDFAGRSQVYVSRCGPEWAEAPNNKHLVEPLGERRRRAFELSSEFTSKAAARGSDALWAGRACTSLLEPTTNNVHLAVPEGGLARQPHLSGQPVWFSSCHRCRQLRCVCRAYQFGYPEDYGQAVFSGGFRGSPSQPFLDLLPRRWSLPVLFPPAGEQRVVGVLGPCPYPLQSPRTCFTGLVNDFFIPDPFGGRTWQRAMVAAMTLAYTDFAGTHIGVRLVLGYFVQDNPEVAYYLLIEDEEGPFRGAPIYLATYSTLWPGGPEPPSACVLPLTSVDPRFLASAPETVRIDQPEYTGTFPNRACGLPRPPGQPDPWPPRPVYYAVEQRTSDCGILDGLFGEFRPYPYDPQTDDWFIWAAERRDEAFLSVTPIPGTSAYFWLRLQCLDCGYGPEDYEVQAGIFARDEWVDPPIEGLSPTSHLYALSRPLGDGRSRLVAASARPFYLQYELDMVGLRAPFGCSGPIRISVVAP